MSTVLAKATGNWSSSSTWALVDPTSYLDSESNTLVTTGTYAYSQTFTPGAITVDGVAIKVSVLGVGGTITLDFNNSTDAVSVTTVTLNTSDLQLGWNLLKFSASQTLVAGKAYKIGLKHTSATTGITLFRNATAANWSRLLRTTTAQSPAAGDQIVITGELTGAGTFNPITVTMDNTSTTTYGDLVATYPQAIMVNNHGTLTYGTSASTNYYLRIKGIMDIQGGGTLNIGTSGTRMPTSSTAVFEFNCTAFGDSGIRFQAGSTVTMYGTSKQRWTRLTSNVAIAGTTLNVTSTSGWVAGDKLMVAPTTNQATQYDLPIISAVNSSTQVTLTAGLTYAHSGTAPYIAEVGNLTSNVVIRSASNTLTGVVWGANSSAVTLDNVEFYYIGNNALGNSTSLGGRGLEFQTDVTGSLLINSCSIHDNTTANANGIYIRNTLSDGYVITNNVLYNFTTSGIVTSINTAATSFVISGNLVGTTQASTSSYNLQSLTGTITNNVSSTGNVGFSLTGYGYGGTISGNLTHTAIMGINYNSAYSVTASSTFTAYYCSRGLNFEGCQGFVNVSNCTLYGNANNVGLQAYSSTSLNSGTITVSNSTMDSSSLVASSLGVAAGNGEANAIFDSCAFGSTSPHTVATVSVGATTTVNNFAQMLFRNCTFGETTLIQQQQALNLTGYLAFQRFNAVAGDHRCYYQNGTTATDTSIYHTASPSLRMTPSLANAGNVSNLKLISAPVRKGFRVAVSNGNTATVSVWVRKSAAGDGTAYNGNQPRLMLRGNSALGISSDTPMATASASAGTWEQLTGTTSAVTDDGILEFFVDCDGNAGWINVDDFTSTAVNDTKAFKFFSEGVPVVLSDNTSGGAAYYAF